MMATAVSHARSLMALSNAAYFDNANVSNIRFINRPLSQTMLRFHRSPPSFASDAEAYTTETARGDILVAFRGSESDLFGAPRIGNQFFNRYCNRKIVRLYHVINYGDPVPFTPPVGVNIEVPPLRYGRSGETWYIKRDGTIRRKVPRGTIATNFSNHLPRRYVAAINAATFA